MRSGAIQSVVLFVNDIDSAASWYSDVLGLNVRRHSNFNEMSTDSASIGIHPADAKCPSGTVVSYHKVDDLALSIKHAEVRGFNLFRGPLKIDNESVAQVTDDEGLRIGLVQTK